VPSLSAQALRELLDLVPQAGDPEDAQLRRLRARARVALAHQASQQLATLPLASALMPLASADWSYLDRLGRERYAAVSLRLLGDDDPAPSDGPGAASDPAPSDQRRERPHP
jgi:hypothetical protein